MTDDITTTNPNTWITGSGTVTLVDRAGNVLGTRVYSGGKLTSSTGLSDKSISGSDAKYQYEKQMSMINSAGYSASEKERRLNQLYGQYYSRQDVNPYQRGTFEFEYFINSGGKKPSTEVTAFIKQYNIKSIDQFNTKIGELEGQAELQTRYGETPDRRVTSFLDTLALTKKLTGEERAKFEEQAQMSISPEYDITAVTPALLPNWMSQGAYKGVLPSGELTADTGTQYFTQLTPEAIKSREIAQEERYIATYREAPMIAKLTAKAGSPLRFDTQASLTGKEFLSQFPSIYPFATKEQKEALSRKLEIGAGKTITESQMMIAEESALEQQPLTIGDISGRFNFAPSMQIVDGKIVAKPITMPEPMTWATKSKGERIFTRAIDWAVEKTWLGYGAKLGIEMELLGGGLKVLETIKLPKLIEIAKPLGKGFIKITTPAQVITPILSAGFVAGLGTEALTISQMPQGIEKKEAMMKLGINTAIIIPSILSWGVARSKAKADALAKAEAKAKIKLIESGKSEARIIKGLDLSEATVKWGVTRQGSVLETDVGTIFRYVEKPIETKMLVPSSTKLSTPIEALKLYQMGKTGKIYQNILLKPEFFNPEFKFLEPTYRGQEWLKSNIFTRIEAPRVTEFRFGKAGFEPIYTIGKPSKIYKGTYTPESIRPPIQDIPKGLEYTGFKGSEYIKILTKAGELKYRKLSPSKMSDIYGTDTLGVRIIPITKGELPRIDISTRLGKFDTEATIRHELQHFFQTRGLTAKEVYGKSDLSKTLRIKTAMEREAYGTEGTTFEKLGSTTTNWGEPLGMKFPEENILSYVAIPDFVKFTSQGKQIEAGWLKGFELFTKTYSGKAPPQQQLGFRIGGKKSNLPIWETPTGEKLFTELGIATAGVQRPKWKPIEMNDPNIINMAKGRESAEAVAIAQKVARRGAGAEYESLLMPQERGIWIEPSITSLSPYPNTAIKIPFAFNKIIGKINVIQQPELLIYSGKLINKTAEDITTKTLTIGDVTTKEAVKQDILQRVIGKSAITVKQDILQRQKQEPIQILKIKPIQEQRQRQRTYPIEIIKPKEELPLPIPTTLSFGKPKLRFGKKKIKFFGKKGKKTREVFPMPTPLNILQTQAVTWQPVRALKPTEKVKKEFERRFFGMPFAYEFPTYEQAKGLLKKRKR